MRPSETPQVNVRHVSNTGIPLKIAVEGDHVEQPALVLQRVENVRKIRQQGDIILQDRSHRLAAVDQRLHGAAMAQPAADLVIRQQIRCDPAPAAMVDQIPLRVGQRPPVHCLDKVQCDADGGGGTLDVRRGDRPRGQDSVHRYA